MNVSHIQYRTFDVHVKLRSIVKCIWSCDATPNNGDHFIFRTYASLYPTIIFCKQGWVTPVDDRTRGAVLLLGQANTWCRFRTSQDFKLLGVTLNPSALPRLFHIAAHEVTNRIYDDKRVFLNDALATFCREVIGHSFNPKHIINLLTEKNQEDVNYDDPILPFIMSCFQCDMRSPVTDLPRQVFMSQRNFERKFKYYTGFTPKAFTNLARLIGTINSLSVKTKKLSDTALEHHYFDQSHFSNEFKRHTGFQPSVFAKSVDDQRAVWEHFLKFFHTLSICPPMLCKS
ncbi:helix-turn-helix domain-containing protein [Pseudochryseolinea flava]|nr:helix-turn-helix transcriptional regulator [Pseudochryseolinea flava]